MEFGRAGESAKLNLAEMQGAAILPNGNMVIALRTSLMTISPQGEVIRTIGKQGEGPGDFRSVRMTVISPDTALVYDSANRRLTYVELSTGSMRSVSLVDLVPWGVYSPIGEDADGGVVLSALNVWRDRGGLVAGDTFRTSAPIMRLSRAGKLDTLAMVSDLLLLGRPEPHGPTGRVVGDHLRMSGRAHATAWDTVIAVIPGDGRAVELRTPHWELTRKISLESRRRAVTATIRETWIKRELQGLEGMEFDPGVNPENLRRFLSTAPFSDSLPAVAALMQGNEGTLWVMHGFTLEDTVWTATALRQGGNSQRTLVSSVGRWPLAFGQGVVLVRHEDHDGVVTLALHRIVPGTK